MTVTKPFNLTKLASTLMVAGLIAAPAVAKVDPATAEKLGTTLTPTGAEKAGNAEGTIPEWTGGLTEIPACYKDDLFLCNPFPEDKPKFVITAQNMAEHQDKLTPGQMAMFKKYPDSYRMPVYQTRRTFRVPERVAKLTHKNALETTTVGSSGLKDFSIQGYPFPIPQNGVEVVYNHLYGWKGDGVEREIGQVTPQVNGSYSMVMFSDQLAIKTQLKDYEPGMEPNVFQYFKQEITSPSRLAGNVLLVHESIDQVKEPRRAWVYNAGQRRVRRAPQVAYDGPGTAADGMRTTDNFSMFNGSPDRYTWTLKGKKEVYIPYNGYKLDERGLDPDKIIQPGHINQDLTRYELHRVWVVEGNLREGTRHIYAKRTFYIDEDTWLIAEADHYDGRGNLWRVAEGHGVYSWTGEVASAAMETLYDLNAGRYLAFGFDNNSATGSDYSAKFKSVEFKPSALRRSGVR